MEYFLLDPSSQGINNLALHFALDSEEYQFVLNGFYQIFTNCLLVWFVVLFFFNMLV